MSHTHTTSGKQHPAKTSAKPQGKQGATGAKNRPATSGRSGGNEMAREEMIAVAAYFRAEHRGFDGGDPVADWLAAEAEVDAALGNSEEIVIH
jgi:hypothetical protein